MISNYFRAVASGEELYTSTEVQDLQGAARRTSARTDKLELTFDHSGDQSVLIDPDEEILDQFVVRPSNTILLSETPPDLRRELLTGLPVVEAEGIQIPDTFDARQKWPGLLTIAMEQGTCGSCWAFATATAFSDRIRITNADNRELRTLINYTPYSTRNIQYVILNNLSPYQMSNCDTQNMGCKGGYLRKSYDFIQNTGLSTLLCNPPDPACNPAQRPCPCSNRPNCQVYRARRIYSVIAPGDSDEVKRRKIQEEVFSRGPVTVGFLVYPSFNPFFQRNPDGIYTQAQVTAADQGKGGGHAVDIIGWGSQPQPYWLIRNSWSPLWAEDGHFKIQYNFSGIMNECYGAQV